MKAFLPSSFALAIVIGAAQLVACSALEGYDGTSSGATYGQGGGGLTGSGGLNTLVGGGGGAGPEPLSYTAECGDGCLPGTGQASSCMAAGGGGAGGGMGAGGGGGGGGAGDDCKLAVNVDGDAEGVCSASGTQTAGDICLSSADCLAGHGCVDSGVCRPYCCSALEACPDESYCALRPMSETGLDPNLAPEIPVCVPATHCELLSDSCPMGQTCTIVRADGTTSCVVPGDGTLDEACPCAAGYVCSTGTNTCKKLCKVDTPDCPVEAPKCQGGATTYPSGFGVCIST